MRRYFATLAATVMGALSGLLGCDSGTHDPAKRDGGDEIVVRVFAKASGELLADGTPVSLEELDSRLERLKGRRVIVFYYREEPQADPAPAAMKVLEQIMKHRYPISFSSKPDFSDYIDGEGISHPREK